MIGFDVFHCQLAQDEALALSRAGSGEPLSAICAAFAGGENPAAAAHAALSSWLDEGWIVSVGPAPPVSSPDRKC